jgi:rhodanese-related sulfurtransferase
MTPSVWLIAAALLVAFVVIRGRMLARGVPQYTAADISRKTKAGEAFLLLDVRTSAERNARSIPGSKHIPLQELPGRIAELAPSRGGEIVCYCASGARSASAAKLLKDQGYRSANLSGGIMSWREGA